MSNACCGQNYVKNQNDTSVLTEKDLPVFKTTDQLNFKDVLANFLVRWGVGRMNYKVVPGLYKKGNPDSESPVLVTANYKLTFDSVRKELSGMSAWILVLDTKGVNVWCAAGKGTFGTEELIRKIDSVNIKEVVSHRTIILPQLGAPGIASHEVTKNTGFRTVYCPVYAKDIQGFLKKNMKATTEMRLVNFGIKERLKVIPMERCSKNCPVGAISVRAGVGCAAAIMLSKTARSGTCACG
jgi:CO dehydrogenase/acetyl-CoA synthase gamma subunit (corrinoid Fe-S protein)